MLAACGRFVWFRPEIRDPGDQTARELEEGHGIVASVTEPPLKPRHPVALVSDDDLGPQMPVARVFLVEPQVAVTPADTLPRLRYLVDHIGMQQPGPGRPVPGFQAGDEALH